jgi:mannose-6-phosphate isomerase-like protein (cupin superfamily)
VADRPLQLLQHKPAGQKVIRWFHGWETMHHTMVDLDNANQQEYKMLKTGKNYQATAIGDIQSSGRVTLHNELALTGSEVSINELPQGVSVPFVHSHKRNEEVYVVVKGMGRFFVDGDEFDVAEGDVIRVDPAGQRCITADSQSPLRYICIQTEAKSLVQFTEGDGVILETKPTWLQKTGA